MTSESTRRPSRLLPIILTLCIIAEACVIAYLFNTRTHRAPAATAKSAVRAEANNASATDARIAALEAENAKLKKALASRGPQQARMGSPIDTKNVPQKIVDTLAAPAGDDSQTKWQRLAALQNSPGMDARVYVTERPFDQSSNTLSPAFVSLFEITPAEQAALEKSITAAREQVNDLTLKNAVTRALPDGSFEIKVTAFPEAGGAAYDQFHDHLRNTLGQERYTAMQATSGRELDMMFSNFGAENRTVTVSRDGDGGGVDIKDVGEHDGMKRMIMNKTPDMDSARKRLGNLSSLLPPNF